MIGDTRFCWEFAVLYVTQTSHFKSGYRVFQNGSRMVETGQHPSAHRSRSRLWTNSGTWPSLAANLHRTGHLARPHLLPSSAHYLVRKDKTNHVYDRKQRAKCQTLQADHKPEQWRAVVSRQYNANAHLYLHRRRLLNNFNAINANANATMDNKDVTCIGVLARRKSRLIIDRIGQLTT